VGQASTYPECGCTTLTSEIAELVIDGVLTYGQGVALMKTLSHALAKANRGQYRVAVNIANAFTNQVFGLFEDGVLSEEQASFFIGRAAILINIWSEM